MTPQLHLVVVHNPFDRSQRDERLLPMAGELTVARLVAEHLPVSASLCVAIDGKLIAQEDWEKRVIKDGEQLVVMPTVHDGDMLRGVLMLAVIAYAPYLTNFIGGSGLVAGTAGTFAATGAGMMVTAGLTMAGSMLIGGLLPPSRPNLPSSTAVSQAYSWSPATTQQPGGVVHRAYGRNKLFGNIIAGYIEAQGDTGKEQIAHLLVDLGTGPYSELSDFRINDQPVGYYSGVTITSRLGHLNQSVIPAFNDTRLTRSIGAKVLKGTPVVRDTTGNGYDALEIVLICPNGLWYANDAGGMDEVVVNVTVEISADGGNTWSYVEVEPRTTVIPVAGYWSLGKWYGVAGSSRNPRTWYESAKGSLVRADHLDGDVSGQYRWRWIDTPTDIAVEVSDSITLRGNAQQPIRRTLRMDNLARGTRYQIRCTNLSDDQTTTRYGDDVYLAEINEVMYDDFQYPRTVLAGVDALATNQLSGSLNFSCMADGAIVRVWSGSDWSSAFSRNPAWICWDILTQPVLDESLSVVRYDGLDPSRLDLASFHVWAQFCDTLVSDGKGGTESRCYFDGVFDTATSMWEAALEVCASARSQLVMRGTTVGVVVDDARSTPAQLFTVGNTNVNSFSETFLPMQDRAASIEVNYLNADNGYARDTLTVVNTAISESAAQRLQTGLRGVTRPSQAWREAFYRLKRNELLKRTASLGVDIDALACTVGDLIWVQADVTRWGVGGRAASGSTTTRLMLDQSITLDAGKSYELKLRMADDTLVSRTITTAAGTVDAVDVSEAFPSAPALYDVWAIGETGKAVKEFLVLDITRDGEQRAKISLIEYNASMYGLDNGIPALATGDVSYSAGVPALLDIAIDEVLQRADDGTILVHLDIHFTLSNAEKVVVYEGGQVIGESSSGVFRRQNVTSGQSYTLELRPVSALGASPSGAWQRISHQVVGKDALPSAVSDFSATIDPADGSVLLQWTDVADVDRRDYGIVKGTVWAEPITWVSGNSHRAVVAGGEHTWILRARDTSGNLSAEYSAVTVNTEQAGAAAASAQAVVALDALGNALITFPAIDDPQILGYELREGSSFDAGALVAASGTASFTLPVLGSAGKVYWIRAKYGTGYSTAGYRIDFSGANLPAPGQPTWKVNEPNLEFTWPAAPGAAQYLCLFEVGGVTTIKAVSTSSVAFPIPKYSAVFRLVAMGADGSLSAFVDEELDISGQYKWNEIVNVALPLTTGRYLNMAFTAANTVKRTGLLGNAPVAPYVQNINDGDLFSFGYNLQNLAASSIQNIAASWFRDGFWREKSGYFESAVVDLGSVLTGSLALNLTKTVAYVGNAPVADWAQVSAGYLADADVNALIDQKAFLSVRFFTATDSPNSAHWVEAGNGDWVTARYVKLVIDVAMASPMTDITVTAGAITIDVPDVTESGSAAGVTSTGKAITFSKEYSHVSVVIATARGAAKAYTGSITTTGCTLYVDTGTQQVDYFVKGY